MTEEEEEEEEGIETDFVSRLWNSSEFSDFVCTRTNPHESLIISIFGIPIKIDEDVFLWRKNKLYRGALAVSCLFISHTCVCIYMCILFAHRDQKCYQRNAACLMSFHYTVYHFLERGARALLHRPNSRIGRIHTFTVLHFSS